MNARRHRRPSRSCQPSCHVSARHGGPEATGRLRLNDHAGWRPTDNRRARHAPHDPMVARINLATTTSMLPFAASESVEPAC